MRDTPLKQGATSPMLSWRDQLRVWRDSHRLFAKQSFDRLWEKPLATLVTLTMLEHYPHLLAHYAGFAHAVREISTPLLRNMGTIGGNLLLDTRCTYYDQSHEWRESIDYCMKKDGAGVSAIRMNTKVTRSHINFTFRTYMSLYFHYIACAGTAHI